MFIFPIEICFPDACINIFSYKTIALVQQRHCSCNGCGLFLILLPNDQYVVMLYLESYSLYSLYSSCSSAVNKEKQVNTILRVSHAASNDRE